MRKVIFIAPALKGGGAERVQVTIANKLCEMGYDVTFLLTKSDTIEYELKSGIKVVINKGELSMFGQIRFIRDAIKKQNSCTVISFFTFQNMYSLAANIGLQNRIVVSERNDPSKTLYRKKWMKPIRKILYSTADRIVFQTTEAMNFFPRYISCKGVIIGNPLREALPEPYHGERKKRLVAFSRLNKQKNLPLMINAFKKIKEIDDDYILEIYGEGEEKEPLVNLCQNLGISDSVIFKGFCTDVLDQIRDATAFLSSSDYEGISNSMLEAMAIGLPCICTDCPCGGARTYIKNMENGILVPTGSVDDMYEAIKKVITDKELADKLSLNAPKIREMLSVDNIIKQWTDII